MKVLNLGLISWSLIQSISGGAGFVDNAEPLNIALSSTIAGKSHIKYIFELCSELQDLGHTVTYIAPEQNLKWAKPYNYSTYSLGELNLSKFKYFVPNGNEGFVDRPARNLINFYRNFMPEIYDISFPKYIEFFQNAKIDLVICDFFVAPCIESAKVLGIPVIIEYQAMGMDKSHVPYLTSTIDFTPPFTSDLSFFQKFKALIFYPLDKFYQAYPFMREMNDIRKKYNVPSSWNPLGHMDHTVKLFYSFFGLDLARPLPPSIKVIGPLLPQHTDFELPSPVEKFLDNKQDILYIAFGSQLVPTPKQFNTVLGGLKLSLNNELFDGIIWGLGGIKFNDFPTNFTLNNQVIQTSELLQDPRFLPLTWAPQPSLLNNPKIKVFMYHGGLESTMEGVYSATPMLLLPVLGDQFRNAVVLRDEKVVEYGNYKLLSANLLFDKLNTLLTNNANYEHNLIQLQSIMRGYGNNKNTTASFILEHARYAKLCRKHATLDDPFRGVPCEMRYLTPIGDKLNFIQYHNLDFWLMIGILPIAIIYLLINNFIQSIRKSYKNNKTKSD